MSQRSTNKTLVFTSADLKLSLESSMYDNNDCEIPKAPSLSYHERGGYDISQNPAIFQL